MGFADLFSDLYAAMSMTELHAEAPEHKDESDAEESKEGDKQGGDQEDADAEGEEKEEGDDEAEGEEKEGAEEEEEEEEEPEDVKPRLEEECTRSAACAPMKHHFDECVERVTAAKDASHAKGHIREDCVEEFFHLQHCASQCAAPKLFAQLR